MPANRKLGKTTDQRMAMLRQQVTDFPTLISSVTGGIAARQPTDRNTAVCFRLSQAVM